MNVLMLSPAYPAEMGLFTRGLAAVGARVIGVGDQPREALPPLVERSLAAYFQVSGLAEEREVLDVARRIQAEAPLDRVECLWEVGMLLAARVREALGLPGLSVAQTVPFRDKEAMKRVLEAAGIRVPRHAVARAKDDVRRFAGAIGYPVILKPTAGAGATDTYPARSPADLEEALGRLGHVAEVSVEELVDGEEFTFDTICVDGWISYHNIAWYRPRPLDAKLHEWMSPQAVCLRNVEAPQLEGGTEMGVRVLRAMHFGSGFTHMEWYRKPNGEVVFGEIGARSPGARLVDVMNYASGIDLYRGWAEAVVHGRFTQPIRRSYNAAIVFKRAIGEGRIQRIEGLAEMHRRYGRWIAAVDLLPVGERRRDWRRQQISDGFVIVRHPDLQATLEMADRIGTELRLYAG